MDGKRRDQGIHGHGWMGCGWDVDERDPEKGSRGVPCHATAISCPLEHASGALGRAGRGRCLGAAAVAGAGCAPASPSSGSTAALLFGQEEFLLPAHRTVTSSHGGIGKPRQPGASGSIEPHPRASEKKNKITNGCRDWTWTPPLHGIHARHCPSPRDARLLFWAHRKEKKRYLTFVPVRGIGW